MHGTLDPLHPNMLQRAEMLSYYWGVKKKGSLLHK